MNSTPDELTGETTKQLDAGRLQPEISSFRLHLAAEGKAAKTVRTYTEAAQWFAARLLQEGGHDRWEKVGKQDVQRWIVWLLDRYSSAYASNQFRALQQFFKWLAAEDEIPDPMAGLKPPHVPVNPVPVFAAGDLARLERACAGRAFAQRRDAAVIAVFRATGKRLAELAGIRYDPGDPRHSDVDLWHREITICGKGRKTRTVKIGYGAARSLDRYIRVRAGHAQACRPQLWLGVSNRGPMTASGIYQVIVRRGRQCGIDVSPHRFRHHFSHTWLDRGGAEGDLMQLNGWTSPQMLRRYGASARSARARRSYDRVMQDGPDLLRVIRPESPTSLPGNGGFWRAPPMSVSAMLAQVPGCPPSRLRPALATLRLAVTNSGRRADMWRARSRRYLCGRRLLAIISSGEQMRSFWRTLTTLSCRIAGAAYAHTHAVVRMFTLHRDRPERHARRAARHPISLVGAPNDAPMSVNGSDDVFVFNLREFREWCSGAAVCGQDREGPLRVEGRLLLGHAGSGHGLDRGRPANR